VRKELSTGNSEPTPIFSSALLGHAPVSVSSGAAPRFGKYRRQLSKLFECGSNLSWTNFFVKNDFSSQFPYDRE